MAIRSTLSECHAALLTHLQSTWVENYPTLFPDNTRVGFSVTADDDSCIRRLEELQKSVGRITLPSMVLSFSGIPEAFRPYGPSRELFVLSTNSTTGNKIYGMPIKCDYIVKIFCASAEDIMLVMSVWLLLMARVSKVVYISSLLGKEQHLKLLFQLPKINSFPARDNRWSGYGHVFSIECPIESDCVIALPSPLITEKRILKTVSDIYTIGSAEDMLESKQVKYYEMPGSDTITSADSGVHT